MAQLPKGTRKRPLTTTHEMEEIALGLCIALNINAILWGDPGAGKSTVMRDIATTYQMNLVLLLVSTMLAEDVAGTPYVDPTQGNMKQGKPIYVDEVLDAAKENRPSIVFWDEFSTGKPDVQAASLTTILDRKAGPFQLPMHTRMIAAANPPKVAANGWELSAPTANRFTHLNWKLDANTIADGLQNGWKAPAIPTLPKASTGILQAATQKAYIIVGAFLRRNPEAAEFDFSSFRGNASRDEFRPSDYAYPSARSWENAAKLYAACSVAKLRDGNPIPNAVTHMLLEGTVGVGLASEFMQYASTLDLPDPVEALKNPDAFDMPQRNDLISALMASVQAEAIRYREHVNYAGIWNSWGNIISRMVDDGRGDIVLPFAQTWQQAMPPGAGFSERHIKSLNGLISAFG